VRGLIVTSARAPGHPLARAVELLRDSGCDDVVVAIDGDDDGGLPQRWAAARAACPGVFVTVLAATASAPRGAGRAHARAAWLGAFDRVIDDRSAPDVGLGGRAPEALPARRRALVVLRAQPLHVGHVALVEHAARVADEVVVVIAAAERSHTPADPLTAGERIALARVALSSVSERLWLCAVPTPTFAGAALDELAAVCPPFDVVVAHNRSLSAMARERGLDVERLAAAITVDGAIVTATGVRSALAQNDHAGLEAARARVPAACWPLVSTVVRDRVVALARPEHG